LSKRRLNHKTEMKKRELKLRKFPYPYKAGLSISNDCEFTDIDFLDHLLSFCNTDDETVLGKGLALPLSSSFFFFSCNPKDSPYYILDGSDNISSPLWQEKMMRFCLAGYLDTIHSYGNFDTKLLFSRSLSEMALRESEKYGLRFLVYTNHGNANNIQNIGGDAVYHQGDVVGSSAYHADMTLAHGIRFLWSDSFVVEHWRFDFRQVLEMVRKVHLARPFLLLQESYLQDRHPIIRFFRFRGTGRYAPNLSSLGYQLSRAFLQEIIRKHAAVVIYQHLGVLYRSGDYIVPATVEAVRKQPYLLTPLRRLSNYFHDGTVWVERLATFLNFFYWRDRIRVTEDNNIVEITSVVPIREGKILEELQYQTVYVEHDRPLEIICMGRILPFTYNGPDETGRYSITISPKNRENIWR
jgi:hypothetical protein